jgi:hypothetical protein
MSFNSSLILSLHRALHGAIPVNLRGLKVKINGDTLFWIGYFDGEPTEEEKEILSVACTEVIADFPNIDSVKEEYINYPSPLKMEVANLYDWGFLRWESSD